MAATAGTKRTKEEWVAIKASAEERQARAYKLRCQGKTYRQIALEIPYSHWQKAQYAVKRHLARMRRENLEDVKQILIDELTDLKAKLHEAIDNGDLYKVDTLLRVIDRLMRLSGLDQQRIDVTTNGQSLVKYVALSPDAI